ncbi:prevent-host-death family protein [Lipingzhangella halophila]|uniref:Antitoxin n=1 Tax=Lipingzhangella halophila TaxID=1783352 RepID=A0A7W7RH22_9ACTN|nr:type II toxin-antitoxin system Phd/YefM family antitoxin [Lipingzhangella halophila]MBB4931760.1 prevent-host-death family protein [Lipingzhangella halophila]
MSETPTESIREVRDHLADVVDRAEREDVPTVVTRRGKEVAAVVSIDTLRQFQHWEEEELNRIVDERMADDDPGAPLDEVVAETLERPQ